MITALRIDITITDICEGFVYNEYEGSRKRNERIEVGRIIRTLP